MRSRWNEHARDCSQHWSAGFTLLEMLVTLSIIAAVATVALPMFSDDDRLHAVAASSVLTSDIELAQVMTISYPDEPVVVRFDLDRQAYWLAYASDPTTPMNRPDSSEPYLVVLGEGRASGAAGVRLELDQVTNSTLEFNAQGGLVDFSSEPVIRVRRSDWPRVITLAISPETGTIIESEAQAGGGEAAAAAAAAAAE